ncbi:unnamed protein product [Strongylus vulgaris]|uniref:Uncharacterized protein n=1 Tax=Strongylus vulgaris TaxID=40348 RepID=A0A3P7LWW3_STRVU|nr:unnamed protein product [Strongylus vulgaris]
MLSVIFPMDICFRQIRKFVLFAIDFMIRSWKILQPRSGIAMESRKLCYSIALYTQKIAIFDCIYPQSSAKILY